MFTEASAQVALDDLKLWADDAGDVMRPLPASVYTSDAMLGLEIDRLFYREWICAGHVSEVRRTGDYFVFDIIDKPVLVLCDETGRVRAFSNVCRHRASILARGSGNKRRFCCPYHAWTYDLDGQLRNAPHMEDDAVRGICLPEYRVELWQGMVFVSLSADAEALAPRLEGLVERIAPFDLQQYEVVHRSQRDLECNWKVLVENFCESYHLFRVHPKTLEPSSPTRTTRVGEGGPGFNDHTIQLDVGLLDYPKRREGLPDERREVARLNCIYPSLAFSIDPDSVIWLSVQPTGAGTCRYVQQIAVYRKGDEEISPEQIQSRCDAVNEFMAEDKVVVEGVQRGLTAGVNHSGPLHAWERTNWEFGRYLAERLLGA